MENVSLEKKQKIFVFRYSFIQQGKLKRMSVAILPSACVIEQKLGNSKAMVSKRNQNFILVILWEKYLHRSMGMLPYAQLSTQLWARLFII